MNFLILLFFILLVPFQLNAEEESQPQFHRYLAQAIEYQNLGNLSNAFEASMSAYQSASNATQEGQSILLLSQIYYQSGENEQAKDLLKKVFDLKQASLTAQANLQLGNVYQAEQKYNFALEAYDIASAFTEPQISIAASINKALLMEFDQAVMTLRKAYAKMPEIDNQNLKANLLLGLAQRAIPLDPKLAYDALSQAETLGISKNSRINSQIYGYKSRLYQSQKRFDDALNLIHQAIFYAQTHPDLLMLWEWDQGRILKKQDKNQAAIAAYRRALSHLEKIRADIPVRYLDGRSSFREMLAPVYMELADLLLKASEQNQTQTQGLLKETQASIESLKAAEMQDYFKNSCAVVQRPLMDLAKESPQTAIIYPIIFNDRLEILLGIGNQLKRFEVNVGKRKLDRIVRRAVNRVRPTSTGELRPFSKGEIGRLYKWLIEPIEPELNKNNIDTLIFVPDGSLRTLPTAMLWDGKQYLIEKYAIATLPGLSLLEPRPLPRSDFNILLAGLSRPGDVVKELPALMQSAIVNIDIEERSDPNRQINREVTRKINMRALPFTVRGGLTLRDGSGLLLRDTTLRKPVVLRQQQLRQLQEALELPGVRDEVKDLKELFGAEPMLDNTFQLEQFKQKVQGARVVHIASHGMFTGDPNSSFVMAHDHLLDMNGLENLFKSELYSDTPVELLTLSACQTAEGDDRSPLGLSGVALRSGARSIMGSLWPVSDNAARVLFPLFYSSLKETGLSKAKSLQKAQLALLNDKEMKHPFYWGAFILIGNWY